MFLTPDPEIALLDEHVINQIAAGEVVERPASAAKELIENALDAGATEIEVTIEVGGQVSLVVSDDGHGMGRANLERCVLRHATSKLRAISDLDTLLTLGFRGEALSSIASVSALMITSRHRDDSSGWELACLFGQPALVRSQSAAPGTVVSVRRLFENIPARRKFQRAPATEQAVVSHLAAKTVLGRRAAGLTVRTPERRLLRVAKDWPLVERLKVAMRVQSLSAHQHAWPSGVVEAFVAAPKDARRDLKGIWLFVNGRSVRDRTLQRAALDALGPTLPAGRFPALALYLELAPDLFDVNVHPQKTELRMRDTHEVYRQVAAALAQVALGREGSSVRYSIPKTAPLQVADSVPMQAAPTPGARSPALVVGERYLIALEPEALHLWDLREVYTHYIDRIGARTDRVQRRLFIPLVVRVAPNAAEAAEHEPRTEALSALGFSAEHLGDGLWGISAVPDELPAGGVESCVRALVTTPLDALAAVFQAQLVAARIAALAQSVDGVSGLARDLAAAGLPDTFMVVCGTNALASLRSLGQSG